MTIQCVTCRYLHTAVNEAPCNYCRNFDKWETEEYRTVEVLEEIKEEIQEMRNDNPSYYYTCDVIEREKLLDLLDEHITRLKGE